MTRVALEPAANLVASWLSYLWPGLVVPADPHLHMPDLMCQIC